MTTVGESRKKANSPNMTHKTSLTTPMSYMIAYFIQERNKYTRKELQSLLILKQRKAR